MSRGDASYAQTTTERLTGRPLNEEDSPGDQTLINSERKVARSAVFQLMRLSFPGADADAPLDEWRGYKTAGWTDGGGGGGGCSRTEQPLRRR